MFIEYFKNMHIILVVVLLIVGLLLIIKGGDFFVDAASWFAEISGIPKFLIGATIVSIATTLPEMLVSIIATVQGNVEMATGNAIGSVTANTGLILGISIVCSAGVIKRKEFNLKSVLMLVAAALLTAFSLNGKFGLLPSGILIAIFLIFFYDSIKVAKEISEDNIDERKKPSKKQIIVGTLKFIFGALGIIVGAELLVDTGTVIATTLKVPDGVIAVTIVAIGTSLPEFTTAITSLIKKQGSLSVGNIIGANIMDMTLILPICSFISGGNLIVENQTIYYDMPFCLTIGLIAVIPAIIKKKFMRWQGILLLATYIVYVVLVVFFPIV
ncbi:MAG: calcium/sodium antiporter [Bacilli bacterium]|jgi:cation:H+ antiporter|nr:calcium/sodium antiporter [Bacilli bacterium]